MITLLSQLEILWDIVKECDGSVEMVDSVLEVTMLKENTEKFRGLTDKADIVVSQMNVRRVDIQIDSNLIEIFKSEEEFLDRFDRNPDILQKKSGFIFDFRAGYLYYDRGAKKTSSNVLKGSENFINQIIQYRELLEVFLDKKQDIIKVDHPTATGNEMIVVADGEPKLLTSISYNRIDAEIYSHSYIEYPISIFKTKVKLEDWLICFKSELCKFIDGQSISQRSFKRLYQNFDFIFNLAERSYQLYLSKFSFDKVRKQFKTEKNRYFEGLNEAQSKIGAQVIAIPLTIGATVLSANVFQNETFPGFMVVFAIATYSIFVIWVVLMHLHDIGKIGYDLLDEEKEIKKYYSGLFSEFRNEFLFLKRKRILTQALGWATISYLGFLIVTLVYFRDLSLLFYILFT